MRSIRRMIIVLVLLVMAPDPARATLFGGTWVPVASATADYCLDGACVAATADASIEVNPPSQSGVLILTSLTIGFAPLGFEFFDAIFGSTISEANLASGGWTIRGETPGFEEHDFTIHILSDRLLTLDGFLHVTSSVGTFDARFREVGFVPVPEPSSAWMVGLGLVALSGWRSRGRLPSAPDRRHAQEPAPSA